MLTAVLDAHLHVVDPETAGRHLDHTPAGPWWEAVDATPGAVATRVREAGVDGGVLVQAVGPHGYDPTLVVQAARTLGERFVAMVAVDRDHSGALGEGAARGATGVRLFSIADPWLDAPAAVEVVERAAGLGLTPAVCCLPEELGAVAALATAVPDVELALDHCGFVAVGGADDALAKLAERPNVVVKLSTGVFDDAALDPAACVARLVNLFGADRIAWGSDHPQVHDRPYAALVELGRQAVEGLDGRSVDAVMAGTARRLWFR